MPSDSEHDVILQLIQQALPVESTTSLLAALVAVWSTATDATSCFVSIYDGQEILGVSCRDGGCRSVSGKAAAWTSSTVTDVLAQANEPVPAASLTVVPFEFQNRTFGGTLLFGSGDGLTNLRALADVSARLVAQLVDSSGMPVDGQRLRDLKLEAMAEFAAGAGHEINNPVATIAGRTSLLLKNETDPDRRRALETIGGQALRIRDMIGDAMTYARPPEPVCETIPAAEQIRSVADSLREQFSLRDMALQLDLHETVRLNADREQFRVVVSCLLRNSLEAIGTTGNVIVTLSLDGSGCARLTVQDDGPGLNAIETEHLFDPFFSGRQAGRGLGFGLSRCWRILQMHGGRIDVEIAESKRGFVIHTDWPIAREA